MTESVISGLIGGVGTLLTILLTGWLMRGASAPPEASGDGTMVMRYPRTLVALGVICVVIGVGTLIVAVVWAQETPLLELVLSVAVLQGLIGVPGVIILLSWRLTHVVLRPDGFTLHSWARRRPAEALWRDVERLSFSGLSGYLRFHLADGSPVRLSAMLRGIPILAPVLGSWAPEAHEYLAIAGARGSELTGPANTLDMEQTDFASGATHGFPPEVTLIEVGLRDGLQGESAVVPTEAKVETIQALIASGVQHLQIASFVHPTRVPQMADAETVCAAVSRKAGVTYSGLALNARGVVRAAASGVDAVDVSVSTNDAHSARNTGMSAAEAEHELSEMIRLGREAGLRVRAELQCVWGCGADGTTPEARVRTMAEVALDQGVDWLSLADSTGQANPVTLARMLETVRPLAQETDTNLILHLHDTRGAGLANVVEALRWDVTHFDTAFGGMGGCPFIPGATGNIPTEDTALLLHGMGIQTGIDASGVAAVTRSMEARLGHGFSGRAYSLLAPPSFA